MKDEEFRRASMERMADSGMRRVDKKEVDLATPNPDITRTKRITKSLTEGKSVKRLLRYRGISEPVASAIENMVSTGSKTRPNARRRGMELSLPIRLERDREALYRGAYVLKASERVQAAVDAGKSLSGALAKERRYFQQHEEMRRHRLDMSTMAQRVGMRFGQPVKVNGAERTLIGWYHNPWLKNDPECLAASGHNFYAEEGTIIGYPGAVHGNCGCYSGPPHADAALVNDVLLGVTSLGEHAKRPPLRLKSRKRKTA